MAKIIDTHVHIWDLQKSDYAWLRDDTSILNRTYTIEELEPERKKASITAGVLVQASGSFEDTDWMLQTATVTEWIAGVVAWLPLTDTAATINALENKYVQQEYFKGVRHQIHDEQDAEWMLQPAVIDSFKILAEKNIPFDVVAVLPAHIEAALKVGEKVPDLRMVFDHLSQPPIKKKERFGVWGQLMKEAAQHPSFYAKISGLGTTTGKPGEDVVKGIEPYVAFVLEHFGINRCFCGGDWPVSLLADSYTQTWQWYQQVLAGLLNEGEQEKVLYSNAIAFYNLNS